MENNIAKDILLKYSQNQASENERALVEDWILYGADQGFDLSDEELLSDLIELRSRMEFTKPKQKQRTLKLWPRIASAAAAILIIISTFWFYQHSRNSTPADNLTAHNDISPGKNTATLTLNGHTITLSDQKTGVAISKDRIAYSDNSKVETTETGFKGKLIAATPRGGTYQFTLPDGTKVWLNSEARLEFQADYATNKLRTVALQGEAYFEVAKDKAHPFIVTSRSQQVEVLGTHFNINSYEDDPAAKTTLLEGSIKISTNNTTTNNNENNSKILKPGEQALVNGRQISVKAVDPETAIDWKNGLFIFEDEPLGDIMRRVCRWYNVEVVYRGVDENERYGGSVSRYGNVSKVLEKLEQTGGIHFKIEGRRIVVTR